MSYLVGRLPVAPGVLDILGYKEGGFELLIPYDVLSFKKFMRLVEFKFDREWFNVTLCDSIKLDILGVKGYCSDVGQVRCFEKFEEQLRVVKTLGRDYNSKRAQHENKVLIDRYRRVRKLVCANSVLLQHFGVPWKTELCCFEKVDCHKVCGVHFNKVNKSFREFSLEGKTREMAALCHKYRNVNFFNGLCGVISDALDY
jgi:hypothetical protein